MLLEPTTEWERIFFMIIVQLLEGLSDALLSNKFVPCLNTSTELCRKSHLFLFFAPDQADLD